MEGFCACLYLRQCGFAAVVALMGSQLYKEQEAALLRHFEKVVLLLDGDREGQQAANAIAHRLADKCKVAVYRLWHCKQPTDLFPEEVNALTYRFYGKW